MQISQSTAGDIAGRESAAREKAITGYDRSNEPASREPSGAYAHKHPACDATESTEAQVKIPSDKGDSPQLIGNTPPSIVSWQDMSETGLSEGFNGMPLKTAAVFNAA